MLGTSSRLLKITGPAGVPISTSRSPYTVGHLLLSWPVTLSPPVVSVRIVDDNTLDLSDDQYEVPESFVLRSWLSCECCEMACLRRDIAFSDRRLTDGRQAQSRPMDSSSTLSQKTLQMCVTSQFMYRRCYSRSYGR